MHGQRLEPAAPIDADADKLDIDILYGNPNKYAAPSRSRPDGVSRSALYNRLDVLTGSLAI